MLRVRMRVWYRYPWTSASIDLPTRAPLRMAILRRFPFAATKQGFAVRMIAAGLVLVSMLAAAPSAFAQQAVGARPGSPARDNSALVVLLVAADARGKAREQRFITEIRLALEGIEVLGVDPGMPEFAQKPLAAQIVTVRELLDRHHGVAATWLNTVSTDLILLHMVVLSSGQALVRLVESDPNRRGVEIDLAVASRELLGTAFLFKKPPTENQGLSHIVSTVRARAAPPRPSDWSVLVLAFAGGGIAGYEGPSLFAGGSLSVERQLGGGFAGRLLLDGAGGPLDRAMARQIKGLTLAPGVGCAHLWDLGPVRVGPVAELRTTWTNLWVQATDTSTQGVSHWSARFDLGAQVRWAVTENVFVVGGATVGATPWTRRLRLLSTGETVMATPYLTWQSSMGVLFRL